MHYDSIVPYGNVSNTDQVLGTCPHVIPVTNTRARRTSSYDGNNGFPECTGGATGSMEYESLKIICWNIDGLTQDKLNGEIIGDLFTKYDMIL